MLNLTNNFMKNESIPCLDLKGQYKLVRSEIFEAFEQVYDETAFSGGRFVEKFENDFARYCNVPFAVGSNNGTSALHLALLAAGIGPGDEVIVPANTFIASVWCISYVGATPVFVDCDNKTWQIDSNEIKLRITSRTKAIIGVHLYGQPFDVDSVTSICRDYGLVLIEDASQAHGASYNGKMTGSFGDLACFSFYPGKNLGACGEAGIITTSNDDYRDHIRRLRNHGCTIRYYHDELGFNYRMGGLEAASLSVKLRHLDSWNHRRQEVALRYQTEISNVAIKMQRQPENTKSVYHLFVVTVEDRDRFVAHLTQHDITAAFHYPVPCHLQKAYAYLGYKPGDFPNSEYLARNCVSLPLYPELSDDEIRRVIHAVNSYSL